MKITIKSINTFTKDKSGNPLMSKMGKPYTRMSITTEEHDKPLSGFANAQSNTWKVGDTVDVEVTENNGYLNFATAKASPTGLSIEDRDRLLRIEIGVQKLLSLAQPKDDSGWEPVDSKDMPF